MFRPTKDKVVSPYIAELAIKKGFDWDTIHIWCDYDTVEERKLDKPRVKVIRQESQRDRFLPAPTQSLLQRWLREVHKIYVSIDEEHIMRWFYTIYYTYSPDEMIELDLDDLNIMNDEFESYEEALEQGLIEALKIIK